MPIIGMCKLTPRVHLLIPAERFGIICTCSLESRKWGFKRWGFKQIGGNQRKKAFFLRFLEFPGAVRALRKRAEKAEKGRKRLISADFQEGRGDTPYPICGRYPRNVTCKSWCQQGASLKKSLFPEDVMGSQNPLHSYE